MGKRSKGNGGTLPRIAPVEPAELSFALAVGSAAAAKRIPGAGVGGMGIDIQAEDGEIERLELTDVPMNRAAMAIRDQFPREKFMPLMFRGWALGALFDDERMAPYLREDAADPKACEVHEAVMDVAAVMPLNKDGQYNASAFFRRVERRAEEIAQEMQGDERDAD